MHEKSCDGLLMFENIETPLYNNLDEVFEALNLNKEEKQIFQKYKKYCEYFLCRIYHNPDYIFSDCCPFIKSLAKSLIILNSDNVTGNKQQFVKEMFSLPKGTFYEITLQNIINSNTGVTEGKSKKCKQNLKCILDRVFELKILEFFVENGFEVELFNEKNLTGEKKKGPEFTVLKYGIKIEVEAKNLDGGKINDKIFGFDETNILTKKEEFERRARINTPEHKQKASNEIRDQFEQSYGKAIHKFDFSDKEKYFLIFIATNYQLNYIKPYTQLFLNYLMQEEWKDEKYQNLIGIVIPEEYTTTFVGNNYCDLDIDNLLTNKKFENFITPHFI